MKKFIAISLVSALTLAASATVFATNTPQNVEITFETSGSGTMNIVYNVDPAYTVTIPDRITLDTATSATTPAVNELEISASNVVVSKGKQVVVRLTDTTKTSDGKSKPFAVKTAEGAEITYTVKNGSTDVKVGDTVLTVNPETVSSGSTTLKFIAPDDVTYAGTYSGTVTFTVLLENT
ncbi:MAG: hypothetical protein ACI4GV_04500 [Acutalibacteraceae bacterium]